MNGDLSIVEGVANDQEEQLIMDLVLEAVAIISEKKKKEAASRSSSSSGGEDDKKKGVEEVIPVDEKKAEDLNYEVSESLLREIRDKVPFDFFKKAILHNRHLFKDKIVLDVGCGSGILSLLAAEAGAAKVIGVDHSNNVKCARTIVANNKKDHIITIIKGRVEDIELPDGITEVDVIISNWMGPCLFSDCLLESVLFARDKWLKKPGGIMIPDKCKLFICGMTEPNINWKMKWWKSIFGYDMSCVTPERRSEPFVEGVPLNQIVADGHVLIKMDLYNAKKEDVNFSTPLKLTAIRDGHLHMLVTFFEIEFTRSHTWPVPWFSTSPYHTWTQWRQTVFYLKEHINLKKGEKVDGRFEVYQDPINHRDLGFVIQVDFDGDKSVTQPEGRVVHENNRYKMKAHS